ncbi:hypothetical protein CHARACLAT_018171 [Characodon lateralis]|uniref:Uncharacterized protein n=1 Tax=Characodon lateralis TaxID=208331 RepID=A0ABU7D8L6_9TELE|nr:hypothetical protein [Characodon lateralis]
MSSRCSAPTDPGSGFPGSGIPGGVFLSFLSTIATCLLSTLHRLSIEVFPPLDMLVEHRGGAWSAGLVSKVSTSYLIMQILRVAQHLTQAAAPDSLNLEQSGLLKSNQFNLLAR